MSLVFIISMFGIDTWDEKQDLIQHGKVNPG